MVYGSGLVQGFQGSGLSLGFRVNNKNKTVLEIRIQWEWSFAYKGFFA